jgi:uroporphyrinogen-III synthase
MPLAGRRIAVTRPRSQAEPLADALGALGATAIVVPLVEVEPVEDLDAVAAADHAAYDWVVFTSATAVATAGDELRGSLRGTRVAAVGPATAHAVRIFGVEPSFVPEVFAAEEIAAGLEPLAGRRVLLPQADIAEPALADELRERGALVDAVVAYRTVDVGAAPGALAELRSADAVVLMSGSAARSLAAQGGAGDALVVCIGPRTAEVARDVGLEVGLVAHEATSEGIIHALTSHFGENE